MAAHRASLISLSGTCLPFCVVGSGGGGQRISDIVKEACDGQKALHICAAISSGDKLLLVDPIYSWFGAPLKNFVILDDLQTIAVYMSFLRNLEKCKIAVKLAPDLAPVQTQLAVSLMEKGHWKEAEKVLPTISRLDAEGWLAYCPRAEFALHEGNTQQAIDLLFKA